MRPASAWAHSKNAWSLSSVSACNGVSERLRRVQAEAGVRGVEHRQRGVGAERQKNVYMPRR